MNSRPAEKKDAEEVAYLIHLAIQDIADKLTGEKENGKILEVLSQLFQQEDNRLSYQNCLVMEADNKVGGVIITYSGDNADALDRPIIERLRRISEDNNLTLDKEAEQGDYYIDTVSINPDLQGKRIGTLLIQAAEKAAKKRGYVRTSLNVAHDNPRANRLYIRLGYRKVKVIQINGHDYDYMVKSLGNRE